MLELLHIYVKYYLELSFSENNFIKLHTSHRNIVLSNEMTHSISKVVSWNREWAYHTVQHDPHDDQQDILGFVPNFVYDILSTISICKNFYINVSANNSRKTCMPHVKKEKLLKLRRYKHFKCTWTIVFVCVWLYACVNWLGTSSLVYYFFHDSITVPLCQYSSMVYIALMQVNKSGTR